MEVVRGDRGRPQGRAHRPARAPTASWSCARPPRPRPRTQESFRDYRRWRYYNTNNLWVDLQRAGTRRLEAAGGVLELPLIVNRKTVDPRDSRLARR